MTDDRRRPGSTGAKKGGPSDGPVPTWLGATFGERPYWPSPPWMTKPGTMRWNTTPSYQPQSASATKLPAAIGDRSFSTVIAMLPRSVWIVTSSF